MTESSTLAENPPADPLHDEVQWQMGLLREYAEIAMEQARDLRREARARVEAAEAGTPLAPPAFDPALMLSRTGRALRLTLAKRIQLLRESQVRAGLTQAEYAERLAAQAAAREAAAQARIERAGAKRADVYDIVERIIEPHDDYDRLNERLDERLHEADDDDILDRPFGELIAILCRDLGVHVQWDQFEDDDWYADEKGERPAGSPLVGLLGLEPLWPTLKRRPAEPPDSPPATPAHPPP